MSFFWPKGSSINDVTAIGGGGQGSCDDISKALVIKRVTIAQNCVTSFIDDPLGDLP